MGKNASKLKHLSVSVLTVVIALLLLSPNAMAAPYTGADGADMFSGNNGYVIGQCMFAAGGGVDFNLKTIVKAASTIRNGDYGIYYYDADYEEWYDITENANVPLTASEVAALVFDDITYVDMMPGDPGTPEGDQAAAQPVIDMIDALDDTAETYAEDVAEAREAYDVLTDTQKALVTNYTDLTDAETAINGD